MAAQPSILCIGPSHKTANLASRERFALVGKAGNELVRELCAQAGVSEVVAVSTCNRTELYVAATDVDGAVGAAVELLAKVAGMSPEDLSTILAVRLEHAAAEHLFRVAAGIESVVIGEAQIQGQLKEALVQAHELRTCGPLLERLFQHALATGKLVRSRTRIGTGQASIGSVAADLVAQRFGGSLDGCSILVLGAGEMSALAARSLSSRGAGQVFVANRNAERARRLAAAADARVASFDQLEEELVRCDVVVSSTSAPHPILTADSVRAALPRRAGRPLVLVDLAVPRDVEAEVASLPGCSLFDLDDLESVVARTMDARSRELEQATLIVSDRVADFCAWQRTRSAAPAIATLRQDAEQIRQFEFERYSRKLRHLDERDLLVVEQLTSSLVSKVLHQPTVLLRDAGAQPQRQP